METRDAEKEAAFWEVGSPPFNQTNITRLSAGSHSPVQASWCSGQEPSAVRIPLGLVKLRGQTASVSEWWGQQYVLPAHAHASCVQVAGLHSLRSLGNEVSRGRLAHERGRAVVADTADSSASSFT